MKERKNTILSLAIVEESDMRKRATTIASIACGLICALCVFLYLMSVNGQIERARSEALERYGGEQLEVCVARHDIAPGQTISANDVELKLWVATLLPPGAFSSLSDVVGSQASTLILSGEVVSDKRLGSESASLSVPEGMVAVSVPAKSVQAVGGAVSAGMKVDVYSTGNTSTKRIGEGVMVLATSASSDDRATSEVTWVTLAVKPALAEQMVSAAQSSSLYFTLPAAPSQ